METVVVRVRSHRATDRLKRLLGVDSLDWRYNLYEGNGFAVIPAAKLAEARAIPGVTLARTKYDLYRCWSDEYVALPWEYANMLENS